jgi:acyl dehydratase
MITQLAGPPGLLPLYAKAALTGPLHRGEELPSTRYNLPEQPIDRDHLATYQRVCGFRVSDALPATYLHVVAFPVTVALMTERAFPLPLVGLVHVANAITMPRPIGAEERVSFDVRAADLRPHPAGRQFDMLVDASVDGETVWTGRSTYLRREGTPPNRARPSEETPPAPSVRIRVPDDIGRRYAAVSGDRNPIHLHALSARLFGFRSAIAHGMWLAARTLATLAGRLPAAYSLDVAFKTPVFLPSTVAVATQRLDAGWSLDVRDSRSGKPHLSGMVTAG